MLQIDVKLNNIIPREVVATPRITYKYELQKFTVRFQYCIFREGNLLHDIFFQTNGSREQNKITNIILSYRKIFH